MIPTILASTNHRPRRAAMPAVRPRLLQLSVLLLICTPALTEAAAVGAVSGNVTLAPMKSLVLPPGYKAQTKNPIEQPDAPRAIVYLELDDGVYPKVASQQSVTISQQGYQFRPSVAAVQTGGHVTFPNRDEEFHSVFSYSSPKKFDLGRFRRDETSPPVTFDKPGLVKIYCEIHKHMRSLLLVLDSPWFTATDAAGAFEITKVPVGEYRIKALLPSEETAESRVTVVDDKTVQVTLAR
jgi:plastocyanin